MSGQLLQAASTAAQSYQHMLAQQALGGFHAKSDMANCLLPLLDALQWDGNPRRLAEALPYFADDLDLTGLLNIMASLNFNSRNLRLGILDLERRLAPCLFLPDDGAALVVTSLHTDGSVDVYDGGTNRRFRLDRPEMQGTAHFFTASKPDQQQTAARGGWFRTVIERFRPLFWQVLLVTLILNVVSLATPLFVMAIYDKVVSTGSLAMLASFSMGVSLALVADFVLRAFRARTLAFVGARLDNILGNNILQQLLSLPPAFTERASVGSQIARLKDFETVREFFTGPLALVVMELPFAAFYYFVVFLLGGIVAIVPVIGTLVFLLLAWLMQPVVRKNVAATSLAAGRRQELLIEILGKMRAVKLSRGDKTFKERFRELSANAAYNSFRSSLLTQAIGLLSNIIIVSSGMLTIALGVIGVIDGNMTMGNLIAVMMLVWRALSPLQTLLSLLPRIETVRNSIRQIDGLMALKPEGSGIASRFARGVRGHVSFSHVSLRYDNESDPALMGVSFEVQPGELVAIVGPNGSGKSSVLKLLLKLYNNQAGSVRIDGTDIRQIQSDELRAAISYVPQTCKLFFGPISQNMRLINPIATDAEIRWACMQAGVWDEIMALPRGIETRVGDGATEHLAAGFVQKLSLARAYVKRSPIMLLDEPVNGLDYEGDQQFMATIESLRGLSTIFIVSHRPSHLKMADRILVFDGGTLRLAGPSAEVLPRIPADLS